MTDVDNSALIRLLDLQAEDSAIARLTHRREALPEKARLAAIVEQIEELDADIAIAAKQYDELAREQDRVEGEIAILTQKIQREEQRLFSGAVANPKELSALQAEVSMLGRKRSAMEDELLEAMVVRDQSTETLERLRAERAALQAEADELGATVDALVAEIDAELSLHSGRRDEIAPSIPASLMSLYDQLKAAKGGVGAAALEGGMCGGCHTRLPAVEVERVRTEGGLQRCDNCRRILVVT